MPDVTVIPAAAARLLLMDGLDLLRDPARKATPRAVRSVIEQMGYVQVDTISVVERAHHHVLLSRLDGYRPEMLVKLLERDRALFEHWTHDASIIPAMWLEQWRVRFHRYHATGFDRNQWWKKVMGPEPEKVAAHVRRRIEREGPLRSRDFEHPEARSGPWWGWKPQKAALEFLWRAGVLSVTRREGFQKVYDLTERVFPDLHDQPLPSDEEHCAWACREALERLVVATPTEVAAFFATVSMRDATAWCRDAAARGEIEPVSIEADDGSRPRSGYALPGWRRRLRRARTRAAAHPHEMRVLNPFDPLLRDRKRAERLFGFDYRFEAFVPAPKRRYGYYVLPILEGDRLVGRLDAKHQRNEGTLDVLGLWWEPGVTATAARKAALDAALDRLCAGIGAERWRRVRGSRRAAGK